MYRIAIVESAQQAREQAHGMVSEFFAETKESAAFVICSEADELPEYYDLYLIGTAEEVLFCLAIDARYPWKRLKKPINKQELFNTLKKWKLAKTSGTKDRSQKTEG